MSSTKTLVLLAVTAAALSGCGSSREYVVQAPTMQPVQVPEQDQPTANTPATASLPSVPNNVYQERTGPITADWAVTMEQNPSPKHAKPPVAKATREAFDTTTMVAAHAADRNEMTDSVEGLTQVSFATEGADFDPRISRDGQFVVFASTQHRPTADIYFKRINSKAVTQLTGDPGNDVMPAISPDGKRIAFASDRNGSWQLFMMGVAGGRAVQLTSENATDLHPTWSPDGKRLAFCRLGQVSGRWEMWTLEVANPAAAEFIGFGMFPEWCPVANTGEGNSDKIVYQRGRERGDRAFSLWTVDYKPGMVSAPTEIVPGNTMAAINPTWSPDGRWVAYATIKSDTDGKQTTDVWAAAADGSATVALTAGMASNLSPCWARDGRVYFVSNRSGRENIWSISTDRALAAMSPNAAPVAGKASNNAEAAAETPNETTAPVTTAPAPQ